MEGLLIGPVHSKTTLKLIAFHLKRDQIAYDWKISKIIWEHVWI